MSGIAWTLVALGIGVIVVRRRSIAVGLVTAQALVLAAAALTEGTSADAIVAATALALRGAVLAALFLFLVKRTRETRPVPAGIAPLARAAAAVTLALMLIWLVPPFGLESPEAEQATLSLVALGLVTAAMRRATLFQVLGIVLVENGLALAALSLPGEPSLAIEIGVAVDLLLVALVAGVFHERIFAEFGAGDTAALRSLRDS
jgi:hydrogenase-4 component E